MSPSAPWNESFAFSNLPSYADWRMTPTATRPRRTVALETTPTPHGVDLPGHPNVVVVMPAYNAEKTLEKTVHDIPKGLASEIILVDDVSHDGTIREARRLGLTTIAHEQNLGYGGNQKTCYDEALKRGADIMIMIHPDYQYDSSLALNMVRPIAEGRADVMLGSRIRSREEAQRW